MRFLVLGPVEAHDGERLPLGGIKPRLMLAALLMEAGRVVAADRLIDILWPDDPPETSRALLHTYAASLRRVLNRTDDTLITRSPGYLLQVDPTAVDSAIFASMVTGARTQASRGHPAEAIRIYREAEALWRGPAYSGLVSPAISAEAARLDALRLSAVEERIDLELATGREREVVAELTALVAAHPTHERLRARLMVALYRLGRQAEALSVFHEGRVALVDQLGIDPGADLQRTYDAILRGDAGLLLPRSPSSTVGAPPQDPPVRAALGGDEPTTGPPAADRPAAADPLGTARPPTTGAPIPAQLPIMPADFTGRAAQVDELVGALTGPAHATPICVIAGRSGTGKSTLALRVAHDVAPSFRDGQLYVNLRGWAEHPAAPVEVLGRFLRALGADPLSLPEDLDERAERFRSMVAGRRMLLVLDDAASEAQIRPLLPGCATSAVLITSRRRLLGLAGASHWEIDVLEPDEALSLLGRVAGTARIAAEPDRAKELVSLCGCLPLAVRIVGARLAGRPHWTLASMAERLSDETCRLDELSVADQQVRAGIEVTYRGLDNRAQAALRALSWLDLPDFPPWIVGPLLDVRCQDGDDAVEALVDAHLLDVVQVDPLGQPRYRIHELIQVYARQQASRADTPQRRDQSVRRLLGTWLWLIGQISDNAPIGEIPFATAPHVVCPAEPAVARTVLAAPAAWLEAEQSTLVAGVERAAALGLVDVSVALATALCGSIFTVGNQFEAWNRTHTAALTAARQAGDRAAEAILLTQLGQLAYAQDDYTPAQQHLLESLSLFRELDDARGVATAQASLGWVCREQGRLTEALHFLRPAHAYFATTELDSATGYTARLIGTTYLEQGDFPAARDALTQAITAYRRRGSRHGEALAVRSFGLLHRAVGELDAALELSQRALAILRSVADEKHEAYALQSVAKVLIRMSRGDEAETMLDQALEICEQLADYWGIAFMLRTRGERHLAAGRLTLAEEDLTAAIKLWEERDVALMPARARRDLADVLEARGDAEGAAAMRRAALATFRTYGAREYGELTTACRPATENL